MDRLLLFLSFFCFICYFLGVVFAQKTVSVLSRFLSLLEKPICHLKEFLRSQNDRIFIFFVLAAPVATFYFFYKTLDLDKLIQFLIVEGTFFAVIYSVCIKDKALKYRDRPRIDVYFNDSESYCYHRTTLYESTPTWSNEIITFPLLTYYISVGVINKGKTTLENVEVVLHKVESKKELPNPFLPLNLNWSFKEESLRIPPYKMSRLINVIEVREPSATNKLLINLKEAGDGPDTDRYRELSGGFRSCSAKPNTLSDIFPVGEYIFHLTITASNAEPKTIRMRVIYDGKWDKSTALEDMRKTHLRVELLN